LWEFCEDYSGPAFAPRTDAKQWSHVSKPLSEYGTIPADVSGAVRNAPSVNYWINGALPEIDTRTMNLTKRQASSTISCAGRVGIHTEKSCLTSILAGANAQTYDIDGQNGDVPASKAV
jgi:hypothetical protein